MLLTNEGLGQPFRPDEGVMTIEHRFHMDTHDLRDVLIEAGLGLEAEPDWEPEGGVSVSGAFNEATLVSTLNDLSGYVGRAGNGVIATRSIAFRCRLRPPAVAFPRLRRVVACTGILSCWRASLPLRLPGQ